MEVIQQLVGYWFFVDTKHLMLFERRLQTAQRKTDTFLDLFFVVTTSSQPTGFNSSYALTDPFHFSVDIQPTGAQKWYNLVQLHGVIL